MRWDIQCSAVQAMEEMLMTAPRPARTICGSAYFIVKYMLRKLTAISLSQLASESSSGPPTSTMPTLL